MRAETEKSERQARAMDTRIYVMTHKEYTKPESDIYRTLHVGKALGNDFGYEGDDTGDNISSKNKNYCELTGIYWLWKNVKCHVVGVCHYRRYFVKDEDFLNKEYIEKILEDYDIIVPNSSFTKYSSVGEHYEKEHHWKDMLLCREVIKEQCPDYLDAFDLCMNCNLFSVGNMVITKKDIFDSYCQWLFGILFEVEKRVDIKDYDAFQARIMGYLSERLFRVWLLNQKYAVREEEVRMIDPKDSDNAVKAVSIVYKCVEMILGGVIKKYKGSSSEETAICKSFEPPVCSEAKPIDFGGKIPVWVLWLQGMEQAPELVKMCVESVRRNLPAETAHLRLITMDNLADYITLPNWIVEKFQQGAISLTHLSDIIRMGLLYRYGGMWIDATYYVAAPIPSEFFDREFFTLRMKEPKWRADISGGRWACNLMLVKPHNTMTAFMLEGFYEYWRSQDKMLDYYLIDYVMAVAYNNLPQIKEMIEGCEYSNFNVFALKEILNEKYSEKIYREITEDTIFFKLTYRVAPAKENVVGDKTFYGYIVGGENRK